MSAARFGPGWEPPEEPPLPPPPSRLGKLMEGRLRKLDWGVATGVGASCLTSVCAVLMSASVAVL